MNEFKTAPFPFWLKEIMDSPKTQLVVKETGSAQVMTLPGRPAFMLDSDVAKTYGVSAKRLNEARSRNPKKFVKGKSYFRLSNVEVANCDLNVKGHHPYAYTKRGCYMFATILKTDQAVEQAFRIVEGFIRFENLAANAFKPERSPYIDIKKGFSLACAFYDCGFDMDDVAQLSWYRRKGLTQRETAKLMGMTREKIQQAERLLKTIDISFEPVVASKRKKKMAKSIDRALMIN